MINMKFQFIQSFVSKLARYKVHCSVFETSSKGFPGGSKGIHMGFKLSKHGKTLKVSRDSEELVKLKRIL